MPFMSAEVKYDNWARVMANFRPAVADIIGKTTLDAYARSQLTVPVDTAFLKNSGQPDYAPGAMEGEIRYTAYYAGYVHEGTFRMPARPFLRDAVDEILPSMLAAFMTLEGRL